MSSSSDLRLHSLEVAVLNANSQCPNFTSWTCFWPYDNTGTLQMPGQLWGDNMWIGSNNLYYAECPFLFLSSGIYTITMYTLYSPSSCIVRLTIDGTIIGSDVDLYRGAGNLWGTAVWSNVVIATSTTHVVRLSANGKNGSSGMYWLMFKGITFTKSA